MSDSFNDLLPGKFYNTEDVKNGPVTLTITGYEPGTMKDGESGVQKVNFITFEGTNRRMIVKPALVENLAELFPNGRSSSIGQQVEASLDPKVSFGGKKVGGLRLRAPSGTAAAKTPF